MSKAYYNEIEEFPCVWLGNLQKKNLIAPGFVDQRDIADVDASDLEGFKQCHFFAGIGGWSCCLRIVGWPDDCPIWSISCPCPPWSRSRVWNRHEHGKNDYRDLWPIMMPLIRKLKPRYIIGEQVAGKQAAKWIDRTKRDLEKAGYSFIERRLLASDAGSPQRRQRNYFFAYLGSARGARLVTSRKVGKARQWRWRGETDLRAIAKAPFQPGRCWPQPLLRRGDDGLFAKMGRLRAYGNAIDPWIAAQFICCLPQAIKEKEARLG